MLEGIDLCVSDTAEVMASFILDLKKSAFPDAGVRLPSKQVNSLYKY